MCVERAIKESAQAAVVYWSSGNNAYEMPAQFDLLNHIFGLYCNSIQLNWNVICQPLSASLNGGRNFFPREVGNISLLPKLSAAANEEVEEEEEVRARICCSKYLANRFN